jgi:hypothetical protein
VESLKKSARGTLATRRPQAPLRGAGSEWIPKTAGHNYYIRVPLSGAILYESNADRQFMSLRTQECPPHVRKSPKNTQEFPVQPRNALNMPMHKRHGPRRNGKQLDVTDKSPRTLATATLTPHGPRIHPAEDSKCCRRHTARTPSCPGGQSHRAGTPHTPLPPWTSCQPGTPRCEHALT